MREQVAELRSEVARLHAERDKAAEVAAEHARSTAKGRPFEEAVFEAMEAIAGAHGDLAEAVGDEAGIGGRKGDVLVGLDGCAGPPAPASSSRPSSPRSAATPRSSTSTRRWPPRRRLRPLGRALGRRAAGQDGRRCARSTATSCSWSTTRVRRHGWRSRSPTPWPAPRSSSPRRDADGLDGAGPARGGRARARRAGGRAPHQGPAHLRDHAIADARKILDTMGAVVRDHLREIDRMVAAADGDDSPVQQPLSSRLTDPEGAAQRPVASRPAERESQLDRSGPTRLAPGQRRRQQARVIGADRSGERGGAATARGGAGAVWNRQSVAQTTTPVTACRVRARRDRERRLGVQTAAPGRTRVNDTARVPRTRCA